ncbi:MAG: 50S ribosomal protein L6, partial [Bacteroidales bacterium]|nr:50S ribosomal protein L6 [Bacteroidales bacterium]
NPAIKVTVENNEIKVERPNDEREMRSMHGLYRALINNMVVGVSAGYQQKMELVGVGYRATTQGQILELALGYSHAIHLQVPAEVKIEAITDRKSNPIITVECADKQLLGQICAKIRSFRAPEPYKGKGIRFVGEEIRRKAGKSAKV